ncbi:hypothetical protein CYMTET_11567 [Cymbomonas tetramitiformis]|uniref:Dynamin-type G domain-containing protein n=1 Tax=Cymbomonas tetramitiformis TaxID=36881 RepID=A0AAE0GM34_9CHLO|nr:hypothetical protein CYMTET_11567 [Cymbomonas tetramitiformis]
MSNPFETPSPNPFETPGETTPAEVTPAPDVRKPNPNFTGKKNDFSELMVKMQTIYKEKILPVEQKHKYDQFYSPHWSDADFEAKPMVLLLGQYSVGKTSFIRHMIGKDFPGLNIGPEPTTDRVIAIHYGDVERTTPGNVLSVSPKLPYRGLERFGTGFLSRFEGSEVRAKILEDITFVDTPGILAGEKQRVNRQYDFNEVIGWFAQRADRILLFFDANKLDVSDEFKEVLVSLTDHGNKLRVVLNKADQLSNQQFIKVHGALMWSLSRVIRSPEAVRVYPGSFWDTPMRASCDMQGLLESEMADFYKDLTEIPRYATQRKVDELLKRIKRVKVHSCLIAHLKKEMPKMWGSQERQKELIKNIREEMNKVRLEHNLPVADFPLPDELVQKLEGRDFNTFEKWSDRKMKDLETAMSKDIPDVLQKYSAELQL